MFILLRRGKEGDSSFVKSLVRDVHFGTQSSLFSLVPLLLRLLSLGKTRLQGDLIVSFQYLTRAYKSDGDYLQGHVVTGHRGTTSD